MDDQDPSEFAFPLLPCEYGGPQHGLTKREWFAGMVMQGLVTNVGKGNEEPERWARASVVLADALIAALNHEVTHGPHC